MDKIAFTLLFVIFISIVSTILLWIYKHLSLRKKLSSIPGPKCLPFVGMIPIIRKVPADALFLFVKDLCFQYKNGIVLMWMGTQPTIHIRKPHQIEVILRSQSLIRKSKLYNHLADWLGNGLLTSTGDIWHRNRRLITPAFHFAILDEFANVISNKVDILNDRIKAEVDKNPNKPINIYPLIIKFTLDTVCETVMGVDVDVQRQPENDYFKALHKFAFLTIYRYIHLWTRSDFLFYKTSVGKEYRDSIDKMHAFTRKIIDEKSKSRKENKSKSKVEEKVEKNDDDIGKRKPKAFLDLLMDLSEADQNPLSLEEIREQVDTFMFGGHDTTGIAISWILFALGNAPDVQKKVQEEIDDVLADDNKHASKQELAQLKYLDRVIKESLRLYPSAPIISRTLDHDVKIDDYIIPKDVEVSLEIFHLHHDPEVWEDPEVFNPDRFLPENSHQRHPYSYLPFSAGPRNCIGQKFANLVLKIALTAILRKWTIVSQLKPSEVKLDAKLVLTPPNETVNLYFKPRNKN